MNDDIGQGQIDIDRLFTFHVLPFTVKGSPVKYALVEFPGPTPVEHPEGDRFNRAGGAGKVQRFKDSEVPL